MTDIVGEVREWMFDKALPFWTSNGIDRASGGYVERFDASSMLPYTATKRVRVIARQIYVFSHAAILGYEPGYENAQWGFDFLRSHAWVDQESGWAQTLEQDGKIINDRPELYDQAFVLFALSWYYRANKDPEALALAHKTLDTLERSFRAKIGYWHTLPAAGHREQNPHMHLLEAMISWHEVYADERFERIAREIVSMFSDHFYNPNTQTLTEFFDDDWNPASGEAGRITEPGHQFEWAWILVNAKNRFGIDLTDAIAGLVASAEKHGVNPKTGVTYQQVRNDGVPIDQGSRAWPNTERLKSAAAMFDLARRDPRPVFNQSAGVLLNQYLGGPRPGAWTEKFDAAGIAISDSVPASTFYHVFLAFSEVLRVMQEIDEDQSGLI